MANDKVIGEVIRSFSKKSIEMASHAVPGMEEVTSAFKVPYIVSDEETRKYISDLDLDNPKKLAMFLVEAGFAAVETVIDSVNGIRDDILRDILSELKAVKEEIEHDLPSDDASERLRNYQNDLIKVRRKLEDRVEDCVRQIHKIDNMSSFERRISAAFIRKNVDYYTKSAKICLIAVLEITKIHIFIAEYIGDKNFSTILNAINRFMNEVIFSNNNISMMNDWALREDQSFWNDNIRKEYSQIMEQRNGVLELFNDIRKKAEEQKVDLEDIVFE